MRQNLQPSPTKEGEPMRQEQRVISEIARKRTPRMLLAAAVATGLAATCAGIGWGATPKRGIGWDGIAGRAHVIVRAQPGQEEAARAAVTRLGGKVERELGIINGFSADVPRAAVHSLQGS